jgi:hypothetical protein
MNKTCANTEPAHSGPSPAGESFDVALSPDQILARLDEMARRGRLPDFRPCAGDALFAVCGLGYPFEHELIARATPNGSGTTLSFTLRMRCRMPLVAGIVLALTVWPGVWLTDSMLRTYWEAYDFNTYLWYLPLTILPIPFGWVKAVRRSRESARHATADVTKKIRDALAGAPNGR